MQLHKPSINRIIGSPIAPVLIPVLFTLESLAKSCDGCASVVMVYLNDEDEITEGDLTPVITISVMPAGQLRKAANEQKTEDRKGED